MLDETVRRTDLAGQMSALGAGARIAARVLAQVPTGQKDRALRQMADAVIAGRDAILQANALDMDAARRGGLATSFLDRLRLDEGRIEAMAQGLREIAKLTDPVGSVMARWERPNGLVIERVRTPIGVIGVIFESRPNVTADAGALCLKAGNAVILRSGSDAANSCRAIHACLRVGLLAADLPAESISLVPTTDREAVALMLAGLNGNIDVIVPRGGRSLVERVEREARVPVFAHLEGVCHVYVDREADLDMAIEVTLNSKMRRTGICGAAEKLLVDRAVAETHLTPILSALHQAGCEIRGSEEVCAAFQQAIPAEEEDWLKEYLAPIITVGLVDGVADAIDHIEAHSSRHTEAIVTANTSTAERFFAGIDSAILLHNASTQFADGGEFGMGAEIGIATGKLHARGPVGVEQLTSFRYQVRGSGQTRP